MTDCYPLSQESEIRAQWSATGVGQFSPIYEAPGAPVAREGGGVLSVQIRGKTGAAALGAAVLFLDYSSGNSPIQGVEISVPMYETESGPTGWAGAWWVPGENVNVRARIDAPFYSPDGEAEEATESLYVVRAVWTPGATSRPLPPPIREFSYLAAESGDTVIQRIPPMARRVRFSQSIPDAAVADLQQRDLAGTVHQRWDPDLLSWPAVGTFGVSDYPWLPLSPGASRLQLTYGTVAAPPTGALQKFLFELAL